MGGTEDGGTRFLENTDIHLPNYTVTPQYRVILFTRHLRPFFCVCILRPCEFVADIVPVNALQTSSLLLRCSVRTCCWVANFVLFAALQPSSLLMRYRLLPC
jgi:hypothetical protein